MAPHSLTQGPPAAMGHRSCGSQCRQTTSDPVLLRASASGALRGKMQAGKRPTRDHVGWRRPPYRTSQYLAKACRMVSTLIYCLLLQFEKFAAAPFGDLLLGQQIDLDQWTDGPIDECRLQSTRACIGMNLSHCWLSGCRTACVEDLTCKYAMEYADGRCLLFASCDESEKETGLSSSVLLAKGLHDPLPPLPPHPNTACFISKSPL